MPEKLSDTDVQRRLNDMPGWTRKGDTIENQFEFKDFAGALDFVNQVGEEAEKMDHHPDLFLHSWNKVKITLTTHSAKGLTENDFELAREGSEEQNLVAAAAANAANGLEGLGPRDASPQVGRCAAVAEGVLTCADVHG